MLQVRRGCRRSQPLCQHMGIDFAFFKTTMRAHSEHEAHAKRAHDATEYASWRRSSGDEDRVSALRPSEARTARALRAFLFLERQRRCNGTALGETDMNRTSIKRHFRLEQQRTPSATCAAGTRAHRAEEAFSRSSNRWASVPSPGAPQGPRAFCRPCEPI